MNKEPKVSVIILNYRGRTLLGKLIDKNLNSVFATEYPNFEALFVDNGSSDNSADYVQRKFCNMGLKILRLNQNYGWAGGNNRAFDHISKSSKYVAFLNNDVVVTPGWLSPIIEIMELNEKVGVAGPVSLKPDGEIDSAGVFIDFSGEAHDLTSLVKSNDSVDVFYISGNCLVVRREVFEKLNGFDEYYFCYYEETDFCSRVHASGFQVRVVPKSVTYHYGGITSRKIFEKPLVNKIPYYFTRNKFYFILKNYPDKILLHSLWLALLQTLIRYGAFVLGERNIGKANGLVMGFINSLINFKQVYQCRKINEYKLDKKFLLFMPFRSWIKKELA